MQPYYTSIAKHIYIYNIFAVDSARKHLFLCSENTFEIVSEIGVGGGWGTNVSKIAVGGGWGKNVSKMGVGARWGELVSEIGVSGGGMKLLVKLVWG